MKSVATEPTLPSLDERIDRTLHHAASESNISTFENYRQQAKEMLEELWQIYTDDDSSWIEENQSNDGVDRVFSKNYPKHGKVFRLTGTITGSRSKISEMLFEHQEQMPQWTSTVNECRILERISSDLYITYQVTNEQAQGLIAKRDFINVTARQIRKNVTILAAQTCLYSAVPPKDNCVRFVCYDEGEYRLIIVRLFRANNGLTAYIIETIDEETSKFTWILNVDLKGWLPQYLINSSLANVQLNFIQSLRNAISSSADY